MPGFDGTGPMGVGPATGWGRGGCRPSGKGMRGVGRGGQPWGGGRGRCFGGWRPWGFAGGWGRFSRPVWGRGWGSPLWDDKRVLEAQRDWLQEELDALQSRLNELDSEKTSENE